MGGALGFTAPWLLAATAALPLAYFVLRLLPPAPRRVRLPSFRLLAPGNIPPPPSARPPWWLLVIRLGALALFLVGLAGPIWQPRAATAPPERMVIVIDNGWSAASQWGRMVAAAGARIDSLRMAKTRFAVLPTAHRPAAPGASIRFVDADTAAAQLGALAPLPWAGDRRAAAARVPREPAKLWIADGVETPDAGALRDAMRGGEVLALPPTDPAFRIAGRTRGGWTAQLVAPPGGVEAGELVVADARGRRLHREPLAFADGIATARFALDPEGRSAAARLSAGRSIAALYLADASGMRPRVVVVEGPSNAPPLESGGFYVRRALELEADVALASLKQAAADPANFFVLVDVAATEAQAAPLLKRVEAGAVVVLFAGPRIAEHGTPLSPVPLRTGARALGGVLSWQAPQPIAGFAGNGPLAGLPAAPEARISRQLLAASDTGAMRWAWLADGTPVVSAARRGAGLLILVHTAADPSWSTLPLTGLFAKLLTRLLPLALNPAATDISEGKPWVLERMLGARGELIDPPRRGVIAPGDFEAARAGAATPAGIYRSGDARRALNFASALGPRFRFRALSTRGLRVAAARGSPVDLGRWLILAAALIAAADVLLALRLRGALVPFAAAFAAVFVLFAPPAKAAGDLQLAYVRTGSPAQDAESKRGLEVLDAALIRRTSVQPGAPVAVDPAHDALGRYPVLYWPADAARSMSGAAASRIRDYLARGGLVLFDFGRPLGADSGARDLLDPLGLPALAEVGPNHVLSKSFYLLPGFSGGAVWAEANTAGDSGRVSGVVIGGGDWAALWSGDRPAAPSERERALRFGVNLVMYALTGTYKADQVHTRALLDRMGAAPSR